VTPIAKAGYRLRTEPSSTSNATIITTLKADAPVVIEGTEGDWRKLTVYIHKDGIK